MFEFLQSLWSPLVGGLTVLLAIIASGHAILHKSDVRAAAGWAGLIWLVPVLGTVLYVLLGINRIRRRAAELRRETFHLQASTEELRIHHRGLRDVLPEGAKHLDALAQLVDRITRVPLAEGNQVDVLVNGDEAFPRMLEAIDAAEDTVALCTYIFDRDRAGQAFADALVRAVGRGVAVKVLVDSVGVRYSVPPMTRTLRRRGVRVARFLHSAVPWRMPYMNLRTHRKILVVDGRVGFTGGMNIRSGHLIRSKPPSPVQDLHFRIRGPVVSQMTHVFAEDWAFTTREMLQGEAWFPPQPEAGPVVARGISDGPDKDMDKLRWAMLGALARARSSVRIVTPYFLPDETLITSLNLAAMRGVRVDIVLPEVNNLPYVQWAACAQLHQVLGHGCKVYLGPPPFDHTKMMVVDGAWSLIGSANWDPRSLRLNFEFNLECYDVGLAETLSRLAEDKIARGRPLTLNEINARSLPVRLRDGVARLASPYL